VSPLGDTSGAARNLGDSTGAVWGPGSAPAGADGGLLVGVEPTGDENTSAGEVGGPAGAVLVAEAARIAAELGVEARSFTWAPCRDADPEAVAAAVAGLAERTRPVAVLLADTDLGRQLAAMVSHRLGSGAVIGCSDVLVRGRGDGLVRDRDDGPVRGGALAFVKPVYGGWLEQEIEPVAGCIPVATLDLAGMPEPVATPEGLPASEVLEIAAGVAKGVRRLGLIAPDARTVDLVHARRIVAAGSGSASGVLLAAARELAELLEGSLGATRPVVDDGRLPKDRLIGQTGRTVAPELYVALGISGSPHHVAGVRKADKILSINRDERAPIFQFSDVGYVADLEVVLPALVDKIREYRDAAGSAA
jgi:electron transfer flavoprotein alpha subunit